MRQNLFIFFEKNEREWNIDCKLAQLAMNRFIIEEETQNEIIRTYNFKTIPSKMIEPLNPAYKNHAKERAVKDAFDKDLISDALDLAAEYQNRSRRKIPADTHFIIASEFYNNHPSMSVWLDQEVRKIGLKPFHLTLYGGKRMSLITKSYNISLYEKKVSPAICSFLYSSEVVQSKPLTSVNDDLEEFYRQNQFQQGPRYYIDRLFLTPKLTRIELHQVENNDISFWQTIVYGEGEGQRSGKYHRNLSDLTVGCPDNEKQHKFVYCHCYRMTIRNFNETINQWSIKYATPNRKIGYWNKETETFYKYFPRQPFK